MRRSVSFPARRSTCCGFPKVRAATALSRRPSRGRLYRNRRIGEFLKELDLAEGRATGIPKILKGMAANGSPAPVFESDDERVSFLIRLPVHPLAPKLAGQVTGQATGQATGQVTGEVTGEVERLLGVLDGEMSRQSLQKALGLKHEDHFRAAYLVPALGAALIEMTLPNTPRSGNQRYRLTALGRRVRQGGPA